MKKKTIPGRWLFDQTTDNETRTGSHVRQQYGIDVAQALSWHATPADEYRDIDLEELSLHTENPY